jgi:very-short-patch-repair endonuclease
MLKQPKEALNKAYRRQKVDRPDIERFRTNLSHLLNELDEEESEEHLKNDVITFLNDTWYKGDHFINTKGRTDLVIHNDKTAKSPVGVLLEVKKPSNKGEMISRDKLNAKALQELLLYYLREKHEQGNGEIKHLVVTNVYEWFIFDANQFFKLFIQNKKLEKSFKEWSAGHLEGTDTSYFYKEIASKYIDDNKEQLEYTWFDLREYEKELKKGEDSRRFIALFKTLSPVHLLKQSFANDSNSLNKQFYHELLHIIGLEEVKDKGKKVIQRKTSDKRNEGSLLENAMYIMDERDRLYELDKPSNFGATKEEQLYNVGLELCITWINRILFLKLLESQLVAYHKGDESYKFLNAATIQNYDSLESLFFGVLARTHEDRNERLKDKFARVPYLNSSLFESTELERKILTVTQLNNNLDLQLYSQTVLKNESGKRLSGKKDTLAYLFEFLEAYDFSSEGKEEIQEESKSLINASVLGLIFEKINGYKDGSFYTPGFITMYMCRETIRRAVVQKFNDFLHKRELAPLLRGAGGVSKRRKIIPYNPSLKEKARELRNSSTKSEIHLWSLLKGKFDGKYDFHRQKPLDQYIADFFCHELKLVIEVDGITHDWEETQRKDFKKETRLNELGLNVLRFTDEEVLKHEESVIETIRVYIGCFEKNDPGELNYEDTPLNPLSSGDFNGPDSANSSHQVGDARRIETFVDLHNIIGTEVSKQEANEIINSLKICDPAVGSGHFLVSALNEIISIKSELKILQDRSGKTLRDYHITIENDELIITDEDGDLFQYVSTSPEKQRVQETLFHEKQTIIENCLFGVDINPNSVKICRLRLWIELLKSAYYKQKETADSSSPVCYANEEEVQAAYRITVAELQTLPNIDINIKCGNSLISRFDLDVDISDALKKSKWDVSIYRNAVHNYKNATQKEDKREFERLIDSIKSDFETEINRKDKRLIRANKLKGELFNLTQQQSMFEMGAKEKKKWKKDLDTKTKTLKKLETELEEIKNNKIYEDAFEWRFEFPEVLDDEGHFMGFDVVIGNPPYIRQEELKEVKPYLSDHYQTFAGTADLYVYFVELGLRLLQDDAGFTFIIPNKWMRAGYGQKLRQFVKSHQIYELLDYGDLPVFEEATTYPLIIEMSKSEPVHEFQAVNFTILDFEPNMASYIQKEQINVLTEELSDQGWTLTDSKVQKLLAKLRSKGKPLGEYVDGKIYRGVLTGLNEAFVIDQETNNCLIAEDPNSEEIIKPFLAGRDIKRYQKPTIKSYLILFKSGGTRDWFGKDISEDEAFKKMSEKYPAIMKFLAQFEDKAKARYDQGQYWWELRACDYYGEFEKEKIAWPETSLDNQFTLVESGHYLNKTAFIIPVEDNSLLCQLNSKVAKFYFDSIVSKMRGGYF